MRSPVKIVLDAWAMLALIFREEPAAERVKNIFDETKSFKSSIHMSWINLGEVFYSIGRKKGINAANTVLEDIKMLPIRLQVPSKSDILESAIIKSNHPVSYADAFAISLAQKLDAVILTGDPEIVALKDVVNVERLSRS